jgi:hypothetical protein
MSNEVKINVSSTDNTAQGVSSAEARLKTLRAPLLDIQAKFEADQLQAQVTAAAAKARAKVEFDAQMEDASKIQADADRVAAEAKAQITFTSNLNAADLKAKADVAAAQAKAQIKFTETVDPNSRTNLVSAMEKDVAALTDQAAKDGEQVGSSLLAGIAGDVSGNAPAFLSPAGLAMGAAIAGGITLAAPLVAGAAAGLGVAGLGALGIAMQKDNPELDKAWQGLTNTFMNEATSASSVIVGPVSNALNQLGLMVQREQPVLDSLFSGVSADIPQFENGIQSLVQNAMPGFQHMIENSGPIVSALGDLLGSVGTGIGSIAQTIGNDAPQIGQDIEDVGKIFEDASTAIGGLIDAGSKIGKILLPVIDGVVTAIGSVTTGFEEQDSVLGVATKSIWDNALAQNGMGVAADQVSQKFPQMGTALGLTNVIVKDGTSSAQDYAGALGALTGGMNISAGASSDMMNDIKGLASGTDDAKNSAQQFADILQGLGQNGQQQVNSFVAAATEELDGISQSFKGLKGDAIDSSGGIEQFTEKGAKLQDVMGQAQQSIGSVAGAMLQAGDSTDQINAKVGTLDGSLENKLMKSLGLTKGQADDLITEFNLWPDQVDTTIGAVDKASPLINAIGGEINNVPDHTAKIGADTGQANGALSDLGGKIKSIPNGFFSMYADTASAQGQINSLVNGNNGRKIDIYVNPIVTGAISFGTIGKAAGGPVANNASGGSHLMSGLTMIDEQGPELVRLPNGSTVLPAANTSVALKSASTGSMGLTVDFGGNTDGAFATAFMQLVRAGKIQIRQSQVLQGK